MAKMTIRVDRDLGQMPSLAMVTKRGVKIKVSFDPQEGLIIEGPRRGLPSISEALRMVYPVSSILSVRGNNWFDRNPETRNDAFGIITNPHLEERLTYTCPVDRFALVELLYAIVWRVTASPGAVVSNFSAWYLTKAGGTEKILLQALILDNTVGARDKSEIASTLVLAPGDKLTGKTYNGDAGGTCGHWLTYKLTEFDK